MNRRPRRRHVPLPARTEERAHRRQLRLSQAGRELADRDHAPHSRQFRRDRDRQHRRQAVSNPPRLAVLRHPARKLVDAPQSVRPRRLGASRRKPPPLAVLGPPKSRPSATRQLSHQHRLRRTVLPPAAPRYPRIAARLAENPPIRRQVARPRVPARVHERLSQKNRMTDLRPHVGRQAPQRQTQHPRSEIGYRDPRQHQKTLVVGDQAQTAELLLARPADKAVASADLERARVPAEKSQPRPVRPLRHLPHATADQTAKTKGLFRVSCGM